jgi:hypothetical protein
VLISEVRVSVFRASTGDRQHHVFAFQLVTVLAVGEAMFQHQILPLLDDGWGGIPEHGKLKQNHVMVQQPLLFHSYVDVKTRVFRIQVDESDVLDTRGGTRHVPVRMRVLVPRVGVINDQSGHAAKFIPLTKEFRVMGPDSENEPDPMKTAVLVMTGFLTLDGRIALQISQWSEHAQYHRLILLMVAALLTASCATSPTGRKQLMLVSEDSAIVTGIIISDHQIKVINVNYHQEFSL